MYTYAPWGGGASYVQTSKRDRISELTAMHGLLHGPRQVRAGLDLQVRGTRRPMKARWRPSRFPLAVGHRACDAPPRAPSARVANLTESNLTTHVRVSFHRLSIIPHCRYSSAEFTYNTTATGSNWLTAMNDAALFHNMTIQHVEFHAPVSAAPPKTWLSSSFSRAARDTGCT